MFIVRGSLPKTDGSHVSVEKLDSRPLRGPKATDQCVNQNVLLIPCPIVLLQSEGQEEL